MWGRLDSPGSAEQYRTVLHPSDEIANALDELRGERWSSRIWVATSMKKLRLTTASSFRDEVRHGALWIGRRGHRVAVSFVAAGAREAQATEIVTTNELARTIRTMVTTYLLRDNGV